MVPMNARERAVQIRKLRQARGWTQRDLATRAGVSESTISAAETARGKTRTSNLLKIGKALKVEPETLLGDGDTSASPRGDAQLPSNRAAALRALLKEFLRTQEALVLGFIDRLGLEDLPSSEHSNPPDPPSRDLGGGPRVTRRR